MDAAATLQKLVTRSQGLSRIMRPKLKMWNTEEFAVYGMR